MNRSRRVVVTGLGLVTPLGTGVELVWQRLLDKASGIKQLDSSYEKLPCRIAALVPRDPCQKGNLNLSEHFSDAERRSASLATLYALVAARAAIHDSNLNPKSLEEEELSRIGVEVGMGLPDLQDVAETGQILSQKGYNRVSPYFIPRVLLNMASGQISIVYGFKGPNHCTSTACATGAHSIGDSFNFIRNGYADVMICGGAEASINPLSIAAFSRLRALSTKFNASPSEASRPFDSSRDGFVMGEGSGILVIEELEHARQRNARIYGEILGYGLSGDAFHLTAAREDGYGAFLSMRQALQMARLIPQDITYVNCHATSTPIGDKAEVAALRKLYNSEKIGAAISSTKGSHGHLLGAAGAVECIFTILACKTGMIPPSLNVTTVDQDFQTLNIITEANYHIDTSKQDKVIALKNSFGFGGTNASLCFSSFSD